MSIIPSGAVKFSDIQNVLGGTNPIKFSEYYADAMEGYSTGVDGIPNRNALIRMSMFRGKSKSTTPLYSFSSHTFTNASVSGRTGPSLAQCRNAYSSASWAQDTVNNYLNMNANDGIQLWTVPVAGDYTITTAGARGGAAASGYIGGRGRIITSTVTLSRGQIIKILVGQMGDTYGGTGDNGAQFMGGGGGGTFVVDNNNNPILISGGGGGGVYSALLPAGGNGVDAPSATTTAGTDAYNFTRFTSNLRVNGGSNSYGGTAAGSASGGGGLNGDGQKGFWGGEPGKGFVNGGTGGSNVNYSSFPVSSSGTGGFGGGAGSGIHLNHENNPGGGGGYSGGVGGGGQVGNSGGGGNFTSGTGVTDGGLNNGHGYVTIVAPGSAGFVTNLSLSSLPAGWSNMRTPTTAVFIGSMRLSGDAGNGTGVQNRTNFTVASELIVSWYGSTTDNCPDIGIQVSNSGTNSLWNWGSDTNSIRFQNDCTTPNIYLTNSTVSASAQTWTQNTWYTARCSYNPANGFCRYRMYLGYNTVSSTALFDISGTSTTYWATYWWSINADNDSGNTFFDGLTIRTWNGTS